MSSAFHLRVEPREVHSRESLQRDRCQNKASLETEAELDKQKLITTTFKSLNGRRSEIKQEPRPDVQYTRKKKPTLQMKLLLSLLYL